jgi:Ca2+-binding RTX toxin-like protein
MLCEALEPRRLFDATAYLTTAPGMRTLFIQSDVHGSFLTVQSDSATGRTTINEATHQIGNFLNSSFDRIECYGGGTLYIGAPSGKLVLLHFGGTILATTSLSPVTIYGGGTLTGSPFNDVIYGNDGDDIINGEGGDDLLFGRAGNDSISGGPGRDTMEGDEGDDVLTGDGVTTDGEHTRGSDDVSIDTVRFSRATTGVNVNLDDHASTSDGTGGTDWISANIEVVYGTRFDDVIHGSDKDNVIYGSDGHDQLFGNGGIDWLAGDNGNDIVDGGAAGDWLFGLDGNDHLYGREGNDNLYGGIGDDLLYGGAGRDTVFGGAGNDTVFGNWSESQLDSVYVDVEHAFYLMDIFYAPAP